MSLATGAVVRERFEIRGLLGRGGMGNVFRAFDRELGVEVALKSVRIASPQAFYRLKAEFRTLADLRHRNLVRLGELFGGDDDWFFSMELVEGLDFLHWVRGSSRSGRVHETSRHSSPDLLDVDASGPRRVAQPPRFHEARLRAVLAQIVAGLEALHLAGRVHRDVKPSNVVVEADTGRTVLLDFGLARGAEGHSTDSGRTLEGTAGYMSPEQAQGSLATAASDWYALGVMLFEGLTGRLPFEGSPLEVLALKVKSEPPKPSTFTLGIPEDLEKVCLALLERDPDQRIGAAELRELLDAPEPRSGSVPLTPDQPPFVGRTAELVALRQAFDDGRRGQPVMVRVIGESGVGKSALVRHFLEALVETESSTVVLDGRCYAQELVPYRAWDGVVDAISRLLRRVEGQVSSAQAAWLLPKDVHALAQVFPVLRRVPSIAELAAPRNGTTNPDRLRRLAFDALRELLRNLGREGPVVLWIDDFHWADRDSRVLLEDVLSGSDSPPLLLLTTERPTDLDLSVDFRRLDLAPLPRHDAVMLAKELSNDAEIDLESFADESGGHPMFLQQLLRHARKAGERAPRLDDMLRQRIERLEPKARRLLEIACIASAPLDRGVAVRATGIAPAACQDMQAQLEADQLLRTIPGEGTRFTPYHDRIREALLEGLSPEQRSRHHAALASALEAESRDRRDADRDRVWHLAEAGQREQAAVAAELAATKAKNGLAFDRAAELYRMTLHLGRHAPEKEVELRLALSDALANAGRGAIEAAQGFLAAADAQSNKETALSLRTRALEQLAMSGHTEQAMELLVRLCDEVGVGLASSRFGAIVSLVRRRLQLRLRGLPDSLPAHTGTDAAESPVYRLYLAAFVHLPILDPLLANELHARTLTDALRAGELETLALCLCREAGVALTFNENKAPHSARALALAKQVFSQSQHPNHRAWLAAGEGLHHYFLGQFDRCLAYFRQSLEIWSAESDANVMNISQMVVFTMGSLRYLGRLTELRQELDRARREAEWRGNHYLWTLSTLAFQLPILLQSGVDASQRDLARVDLTTPLVRTKANEWYLRRAQAEEALYVGADVEELVRWTAILERFRFTPYGLVLTWGSELRWLLGRLALARADAGDPRALRSARKLAKKLVRRKLSFARIWGEALRAGVRLHEGDLEGCRASLEECAVRAELHGLMLVAACARYRMVELGFASDDVRRETLAYFAAERIRDPAATARLMMPGFRPAKRLASGSAPALPG
ncbi:MAG: AAA family ATPase [Sandaracinus sp.]|nr:AAA family ATPase [Sandaracinus sp.]